MATWFSRYNDIKTELRENYDEIAGGQDPEGEVMERAVSWIPVYYNDIITEWHQEMPNHFTDRWQEFGSLAESKITDLMRVDLDFWYSDMGTEAWEEIKAEKLAESEAI